MKNPDIDRYRCVCGRLDVASARFGICFVCSNGNPKAVEAPREPEAKVLPIKTFIRTTPPSRAKPLPKANLPPIAPKFRTPPDTTDRAPRGSVWRHWTGKGQASVTKVDGDFRVILDFDEEFRSISVFALETNYRQVK